MKKNNLIIDNILSGLDRLDLKESLRDEFSNNTYLPILKDRSVLNAFGTLTAQQLAEILRGSGFHQSATTAKWDQHFFGPIKGSKVRLTTFLRNTNEKATATTSETVTLYTNYYTNYKFLTEASVDVTPTDLTGRYIIATSGTSDAPIAYVKSPADPKLFVGRRPSGSYGSFSGTASPSTSEGHLVKSFAKLHSKQVLDAAVAKVMSFSDTNEKAILQSIIANTQQYPVLFNSICYALVDVLNIVTSATQAGTSKQAGNALLGHNYLTHNTFDDQALFSLSQAERDDIKTELQKLVSSQHPYVNKWLPPITAFFDADKKARSASSLYKAILNMFFSSFGNIFSVLSKSTGYTTGQAMPLTDFLPLSSPSAKIAHTFALTDTRGGLYKASPANDRRLFNPFIRLVWEPKSSGSSFYYSLRIDLISLIGLEPKKFISPSIKFGISDIKVARLPNQAVNYLINDIIKTSGNSSYDETAFLNIFSSAGSAAATVNSGNESILRSILHSKIQPYVKNNPIFSTTPDVLYAGMPKLFMQLGANRVKIKVMATDIAQVLKKLEPVQGKDSLDNTVWLDGNPLPSGHAPHESIVDGNGNTILTNSPIVKGMAGVPLSMEKKARLFTMFVDELINALIDTKAGIPKTWSVIPEVTRKFVMETLGTNNHSADEFNMENFIVLLTDQITDLFTKECEDPKPLVTELLSELYDPATQIDNIGSSEAFKQMARVIGNLQLGLWVNAAGKLGGTNIVGTGSVLQLNTDEMTS